MYLSMSKKVLHSQIQKSIGFLKAVSSSEVENRGIIAASRVLFISLVALLFFTSCNKENAPDIVKSTGEEITVSRNLESFNEVIILDEFDVELVYDSIFKVEVTFGKNLVDKVLMEVKNGVLTMENGNKFNWVRKMGQRIKVKLHCSNMAQFEMVGDGTLTNQDTFYGDRIYFEHAGTNDISLLLNCDWATFRCSNVGNLTFKGSCGILSGTTEQTSSFDGKDFESIDGYFFHYSLSPSYIKAKQVYGLNLYSTGDLFYMQEPLRKFEKQEVGSGRVRRF